MERTGFAVRQSVLLAICQKSFVKYNGTFGYFLAERQGQEYFLRNTLMDQLWNISEPKSFVVIGVTYKNTTLATHGFQQRQSFINK